LAIKIRTPLYEEHLKLKARIVEFGGWDMPVFYTNVIDEHNCTRTRVGIFDICHMGEIIVEGKAAFDFIQKLITNDLKKLIDGKAFYTHICLENGCIIDDLFIYRFNEDKYMFVVNAANIEKDYQWMLKHKVDGVSIINKSDEMAKLDLQGPKSQDVLAKLVDYDLIELKRFCFVEKEISGIKVIVSRTGYTGEDGFELYFDSSKAVDIWNRILEEGKEFGIQPIGLGARDTLRIEACYSLYGHELSEHINPIEASTSFVVKLDKDDFIGKGALVRVKENGVLRKVVAFEMIDKAIPRKGYVVSKDGVELGYVTSGTMSPMLKKGIGLAFVKVDYAIEGNEININIRGKLYSAKIVRKPIYKFNGGN